MGDGRGQHLEEVILQLELIIFDGLGETFSHDHPVGLALVKDGRGLKSYDFQGLRGLSAFVSVVSNYLKLFSLLLRRNLHNVEYLILFLLLSLVNADLLPGNFGESVVLNPEDSLELLINQVYLRRKYVQQHYSLRQIYKNRVELFIHLLYL